ncbi:hypothetical protein E3J79_02715 [Candidatus Dependentiae bacterium]|nr:MAG: hypothetical protein E3J79_02715 [Candidatus Dependentiae bacterium]
MNTHKMNNHKLTVTYFYLLFFISLVVAYETLCEAKKALVIVPVADLVGQPLSTSNVLFTYHNIPLAAGTPKQSAVCPRLHQLLFNEIVDVIEEQDDEVQVNIATVYHLIQISKKPQITYWTHKKNLVQLNDLEKRKIAIHKIPSPIDFNNPSLKTTHSNTITLLFPWVNPITKQVFSSGTRFVLTPQQLQKNYYSIYLFNPMNFSFTETAIPKQLCLHYNNLHNNGERIALFIQLLHKWAHQDNGFIPYVWGGCSFINACKKDMFTSHEIKNKKQDLSYFVRDEIQGNPKNGFDCSGLIARAAQICGIPYFLKNTTTLAVQLASLQKKEKLHEGDLIWMPGHVMVVANIINNTIIEARGYRAGYGKIHELPLHKVFKDITTFSDLQQTYFNNKPLYLLSKENEISSTITTYKLLKLASIWNQQASHKS